MEKSIRVILIIQLCLAFTLICWIAGKPFNQDHLAIKSRANLYQHVMGLEAASQESGIETKAHLKRNSERFKELPYEAQETIQLDYQILHAYASRSFFVKFEESLKTLFIETSPYVLAWIFFSILISVMALLGIDGALTALWLLPLIAICYVGDNFYFGQGDIILPENKLFPSERVVVSYLDEPLSQNIFDQKGQLEQGWKRYLVKEWSRQEPNVDFSVFAQQVENGEFEFTKERLLAIHADGKIVPHGSKYPRENILLLVCYVVWNIFLAYSVTIKGQQGQRTLGTKGH